ncbi:hypothetical protein BFP77_04570 [Maribacter sp. 4U21]|uniref:hybrid sensor histidine kinase/response regulator transcription factor n=1 Tax=Maribacter sp. 4U21 TaxID=1889779 RepID=UPI000C153563|nr:two-component regulator propeller domain-containing protein [Maribacter sp. 4U21]PIB30414.1 hypothetical protein BFP77_04570 [Maribacter sp. 4U21]
MYKNRKLRVIFFSFQIVLLILINSYEVHSQDFEIFSNKEGFNQNTINSIVKDRYGFLWFGTPNGLIRYDGYEFKTFTTQSDTNGNILSNDIKYLYSDINGIVWIGTNLGMNVYVPMLEKFYTIPLLEKVNISHIDSGPNGQIWFSGENKLYACKLTDVKKGVFKLSDNILKPRFDIPFINDFIFRDESSILLGSSKGLWNLELEKIPTALPEIKSAIKFDILENSHITSLLNRNGIVWIGAEKGLYKISLQSSIPKIIKNFNDILGSNSTNPYFSVDTIFEDNNSIVWVGTENDGLYKFDTNTDSHYHYVYDPRNEFGLSSQNINTLYQDDYNVLWIGTAQGGINKLDLRQKQFVSYTHNPYDSESLSDNLLTAILEDKNGILWLSGYNKPLFRSKSIINKNTLNSLKFEDLRSKFPTEDGDIVRSIYEDDKGYLWFGTDQSVIVYNPSKKEFKKVEITHDGIQLINEEIRDIYQVGENNMLLLGNKIVILKNPWEDIDLSGNPTLEVASVTSLGSKKGHKLLRASDGSFWFGTNKGLLHGELDGEKIELNQFYSDGNRNAIKLSYENVFSLHQDDDGIIWVGTFGGGLNKIYLDSEGLPLKIDLFRKNDLLPDDAIYGILQEDNDYLWLSTDMGLVRFHLKDRNVEVFDVRDGLAHNNFRQGSFFKGDSGYFYFGGLNGLIIFDPKNIKLNEQTPKVLITDLFINNKRVGIGERFKDKIILDKSISETDVISVSQKEHSIAFGLAVDHTSTPLKNRVAYKLEGFNEEWIEIKSGKTNVAYTNLPARNFLFKVKAGNGDGIWSSEIKSLRISIVPPWYRSWWGYLIFAIIAIGIAIGIIVYFSKNEKLKQRLKYEKLDKDRLEIINQGKFRYFTNLSHEFRTPLTLISGPLECIISNNPKPENIKYLALIQKNTKRLLSLVDQLITFRQSEQGHLKLNLSKDTLAGFIFPTTEAFENYALERDINFFYKVSSPEEEIIIDVEKLERIIFNLLSNSFKNTPPLGDISIECKIIYENEKKLIQIDVVDSGKGIPTEDLENIFERFYQLGNKKDLTSGGGIGLSFCKSLVNILDGEIYANSNPGVETRFTVIVPSKTLDNHLAQDVEFSEKSFVKNWIPLSVDITERDTVSALSVAKKNHSILLVENEVDVQTFLKGTLSTSYNIEVANNGVEGLEKITINEPDLVISDIMMPEMDGFQLCSKIKDNPDLSHIPVLLLTALGDTENTIKGLEYGADDYLSKPFSIKHLKLRIDKLIQNRTRLKAYFSENSKLPKTDIEIPTKDKEFLIRLIEVIESNISDSGFGVEELANKMNLSTSHLYRRLKKLTGQVPNAYLRNFRLQRAAELLKNNTDYTVAEVMYQIGIESNSYFSTSFKKLHGVSPSDYFK